MSANCGILHYCMNSEVVHLTSPNATGPYAYADTGMMHSDLSIAAHSDLSI